MSEPSTPNDAQASPDATGASRLDPPAAPAAAPEQPLEHADEVRDAVSEFRFQELGRAGPAALVAAVLPALGGFVLLGTLPVVGPFIEELGLAGMLLYAGVFALTSGLAILPTYAQAALGGWAFGPVWGTVAALAGFVGGSLVGYGVARTTTGDDAMGAVTKRPKWNAVYRAFVAEDRSPKGLLRTLGYVTLIRIPPNSPFALTNLLMASARVPLPVFVLGTAVGMLPRTALVVWIGASVQELTKDGLDDAKPGWLLWTGLGVSVAVLFALVQVADRAIRKAVVPDSEAGASPHS